MSETTVNQGVSAQNWNINRYDILEGIYNDVQWLENKAKQKRCVGSNKIQAVRTAIYGRSIILQGLRDLELENLKHEIENIKKYLGMI